MLLWENAEHFASRGLDDFKLVAVVSNPIPRLANIGPGSSRFGGAAHAEMVARQRADDPDGAHRSRAFIIFP